MGGGYDDDTYYASIQSIVTKQMDLDVIIPENETNLASDTLIQSYTRNFYSHKPISDEVFNIYNGMFKYDKTPINATIIEDRIDINDAWYKQVVEL